MTLNNCCSAGILRPTTREKSLRLLVHVNTYMMTKTSTCINEMVHCIQSSLEDFKHIEINDLLLRAIHVPPKT